LQDVILNIFFITTIPEHLSERLAPTHATSKATTNVGRVHVLVKLVRICYSRRNQGLSCARKGPECGPIGLDDDILRNAISTGVPTSGNLTSNRPAEFEGLRNKHSSAFLEFDEPLFVRGGPDVTLVAVFVLELFGLGSADFNRFKVVGELYLLIENFPIGVISPKEFGL
jgi:hypothetical protein